MPNTRVAVAMSGGVDSSVAALLLKQAGYDVIGVTMALWSCHRSERTAVKTCCSLADVADARAVCERIGIPHVVADYRTEFRAKVMDHFAAEYSRARTPIPCIGCNQYFKFERLWATVRDEYGAAYLATGHYARITRGADNSPAALLCGRDSGKDQSYFLFVITPEQLRHTLFPLGELTKDEVRAIASRHGLTTAEKPDSQEICFVPDNDYSHFLETAYPGAQGPAGEFVDERGTVLGRHRGTHAFTIGQRRGLGLAFSTRRYVSAIDPATGRVTLSDADALYRPGLLANGLNWLAQPPARFEARARIRSTHTGVASTVRLLDDGAVRVEFSEPQKAVAPGQAVVFYRGDEVLGGGWIDKAL